VSLQDLKQVDVAVVLKGGRRAGTLRREGGGTTFRYDEDHDGPDVALTLPRGDGPFHAAAGAVPPFFAGLLPEGRRLSVLRRAVKTSADDELSLLLAIGSDAIGDVRVVPGTGSAPRPAGVAPADLTRETFKDLYTRVLSDEPDDLVGLPGIQDKLSGGMIALPMAWGVRPAILKLTPPEFPGVVENEAFFLGLARLAGVRVPDHEVVHDASGAAGLLVARFDRVVSDGEITSLAQEDGCQVLGLYPADKYRPSTEDVLEALTEPCGAPVVAARDLLRQVAFSYAICNGDLHAKNLSIGMGPDGEWWPTPAYDVLSTHPYGDTSMALSIDGKLREDITRANLIALGTRVGLPARATERVLDEVVSAIRPRLDDLDPLPFHPHRIHKLRRAIAWRLDALSAR